MGVVVKDKRTKWDRLVRQTRRDRAVTAGVRGDVKPRAGTGPTNPELAMIHEFGGGDVPERSFIRSTVDKNAPVYRKLGARLGGLVVGLKMTMDQALDLLGTKVAADMRKTIRDGVPPPLEDATVARKGSTKPLIDTGQLIGSITHKVEK